MHLPEFRNTLYVTIVKLYQSITQNATSLPAIIQGGAAYRMGKHRAIIRYFLLSALRGYVHKQALVFCLSHRYNKTVYNMS